MPPVCHTHIRIEASTLYTYTGRMYIISSELWPDHIDSKTACPYKNCHTWLKLSRGAVGPCVPPTGGHPLLIPLPSISTSVYASSSSCILCVWHTLLNDSVFGFNFCRIFGCLCSALLIIIGV